MGGDRRGYEETVIGGRRVYNEYDRRVKIGYRGYGG